MHNILVYGATGVQGKPVARQLLAAGYRVRVLVRKADTAADLRDMGAEVVIGDMADLESLHRASAGMDGMFLLVPFFDPQTAYGINAIRAARAAGIRRIVWNTSGTIMPVETGNPGVDMRRLILAELEASGIDYAALQPTIYMENLLGPWTAPEVASGARVAYPIPNTVRLQWISHEDAAAYCVAAFGPDQGGKHSIEICGPEILTGTDMAQAFTRALGRPISFRPMPPREFGDIMDRVLGGGGNEVTAFYDAVYANPDILSSRVDYPALAARLRIVPTPMEAFVRRNAGAFGGATA
jgi:NAD(P)H dehydrogenase (quinone)